MRRSTALRLVLLAWALLFAVGVTAAPAPVYRPKPTTPWVTGWDMPVDPIGDCRFDKKGDKLTISVPGRAGRTTAPRMLREIEGDFDVTVRVTGAFAQKGREAGVLITDGTNDLRFGRGSDQNNSLIVAVSVRNRSGVSASSVVGDNLKPVYIRVERRKNVLTVKHRTDRQEWSLPFEGHSAWVAPLPGKLKVGVFAESMAPGVFEPVFDQFELTPAK
jgi:regulation of enolase protein 1 (concanavalin A-like superfamily)